MTTDNFCFYLQNRLIQTSQARGQQYIDTSPFSIPCSKRRDAVYFTPVAAHLITNEYFLLVRMEGDGVDRSLGLINPLTLEVPHPEVPDANAAILSA